MDLISFGVRMDTGDVARAASELDQLANSAHRLKGEIKSIGPDYSSIGKVMQDNAIAARASAVAFHQQGTSLRAAMLGTTAAVQQGAVATKAATSAYLAQSGAVGAATMSARQYSNAMRMLPAQITDIVTGLSTGQPAFQVAIQQGGQIRDIFGGFGNALRGVASLLTPARLAIGGTVAAAALLAKAYNDAQKEAFALSRAIVMSGNAAGITRDEIYAMAGSVDALVGTQASAAATIAQLVSTGRVGANNLKEFATAAQQLERTTGQSVEETVKIFAELGRSPVEASRKLNEQVNFLTIATYEQIKALQSQGRETEAAEVAQRAYSSAMTERTRQLEQELGALQRMARGTGEFFGDMWDRILNIGRPTSVANQIAALEADLQKLQDQSRFDAGPDSSRVIIARRQALIDGLKQQIAQLRSLQRAQEDAAKASAAQKKALDDHIASQQEDLRVGLARKALMEDISRQRFDIDISGIKRTLDSTLGGYSAYTATLEALRSADMVSEEHYYEAKRTLIERDAAARDQSMREESARIRQELSRLVEMRNQAGRDALERPGASGRTGSEADRIRAEMPFDREIAQLKERLLDLDAERAEVGRKLAAETATLNIQQAAGATAARQALVDARDAAQSYFDTLQQANNRRLESFGMGDRAREIANARNEVDDRFAQQRLDLDREFAAKRISEEAYQERLEILREFNHSALAETDRYYAALAEKESSFLLGAREAIANYTDSASNVAARSKEVFTSAFQSMEDALVGFVQKGKLDFKSLADSIIADLLRMQIRAATSQIFGSLLGALGGMRGSSGSSVQEIPMWSLPQKLATGTTRVPRDDFPAILHKDEAVLPAKLNPWAGGKNPFGGGGVTVNMTMNMAPGNNVAQLAAAGEQLKAEVLSEVFEGLRRNRWGLST